MAKKKIPVENKDLEEGTSEEKVSKEETSKKEKKTKVLNGFILFLVIFILAIIGIYVYSVYFYVEPEIVLTDFNGYHFVKDEGGLWNVAMNGYVDNEGNPYVLNFHYTPYDLIEIPVNGDLKSILPSNKTYISTDMSTIKGNPDKIKAVSELSIKLATSAFFIQKQLLNPVIVCNEDNHEACIGTEVISCEDNSTRKVIYIEDSESTSIKVEGNCITLSAKKGEYVKVVDRLLYSWVGIME